MQLHNEWLAHVRLLVGRHSEMVLRPVKIGLRISCLKKVEAVKWQLLLFSAVQHTFAAVFMNRA